MLLPKSRLQAGFSLIELMIAMVLVGVLFTIFGTFFTNYLTAYTGFQRDGSNFTELTAQTERVGNVLRGLTDFVSEAPNDLVAYAYFSPADAYTSIVHYYIGPTGKTVMVDVTPMTANPPNGTVITASKKTYTIISNYLPKAGTSLFTYYDSAGGVLTPPVANQHSIVDVQVNLVAPGTRTQNGQELDVKVSLRNRKTNL